MLLSEGSCRIGLLRCVSGKRAGDAEQCSAPADGRSAGVVRRYGILWGNDREACGELQDDGRRTAGRIGEGGGSGDVALLREPLSVTVPVRGGEVRIFLFFRVLSLILADKRTCVSSAGLHEFTIPMLPFFSFPAESLNESCSSICPLFPPHSFFPSFFLFFYPALFRVGPEG